MSAEVESKSQEGWIFLKNILKFTKFIIWDIFIKNIKIVAIIFLIIILILSLVSIFSSEGCIIEGNISEKSIIDLKKILQDFSSSCRNFIQEYTKNIICKSCSNNNCTFVSTCEKSNLSIIIISLLYIYLVIYAGSYLLGMSQITLSEFIPNLLKLILVAGLLNGSTMDFLYNTVLPIIGSFYDIAYNVDIFNWIKDVNFSTLALKLLSMLMSPGIGTLYFASIIVSFYTLIMFSIEIAILILISEFVVNILIALAPIFLIFILFKKTIYIYSGWLTQVIAYTITPIIILLVVVSIFEVNLFFLNAALSFTVCMKPFTMFNLIFWLGNNNLSTVYLYSFIPWGPGLFETGNDYLNYSGSSLVVFGKKLPELICFVLSVFITYYFYEKAKSFAAKLLSFEIGTTKLSFTEKINKFQQRREIKNRKDLTPEQKKKLYDENNILPTNIANLSNKSIDFFQKSLTNITSFKNVVSNNLNYKKEQDENNSKISSNKIDMLKKLTEYDDSNLESRNNSTVNNNSNINSSSSGSRNSIISSDRSIISGSRNSIISSSSNSSDSNDNDGNFRSTNRKNIKSNMNNSPIQEVSENIRLKANSVNLDDKLKSNVNNIIRGLNNNSNMQNLRSNSNMQNSNIQSLKNNLDSNSNIEKFRNSANSNIRINQGNSISQDFNNTQRSKSNANIQDSSISYDDTLKTKSEPQYQQKDKFTSRDITSRNIKENLTNSNSQEISENIKNNQTNKLDLIKDNVSQNNSIPNSIKNQEQGSDPMQNLKDIKKQSNDLVQNLKDTQSTNKKSK